ncbi:MAG: class I SAM-dependent methyltransferase [Bacilli bacterium]|nr:class I SAM-dependent methyltransferase [Bacilli bacterium]
MSHYFTNDINLKHNVDKKNVVINGKEFTFFTDNGVFSKKGLDFGTRTLLESLPEDLKGDILDFGCGYGPIGIYLKKSYDCEVDMLDINERSVSLAKKNADLNNAEVNIFLSDIYSNVNKKYDYIVTNPPIRVGKQILYKILFDAKDYLKENGKIYLVINKDQGAKSLMKDLANSYKVSLVNKNKGFFIICAEK